MGLNLWNPGVSQAEGGQITSRPTYPAIFAVTPCGGTTPLLVFAPGGGGGSESRKKIKPGVARFTRVKVMTNVSACSRSCIVFGLVYSLQFMDPSIFSFAVYSDWGKVKKQNYQRQR